MREAMMKRGMEDNMVQEEAKGRNIKNFSFLLHDFYDLLCFAAFLFRKVLGTEDGIG